MAVKKTTEAEEILEEKAYDPWTDMRTITIPRGGRNEEKAITASVNNRDYIIPKGKPVEVPYPVWKMLTDVQAIKDQEADVMATIPNNQ